MQVYHFSLFLVLTLNLTACNYRLFDLVEMPELQGGNSEAELVVKPTEENYASIFKTVIQQKCIECHQPGGRAESLPMETYQDLVTSDFGPALVVPGKPEESPLYLTITSAPGVRPMPPPRSNIPPVEKERADIIRVWIENGAPES